MEIKIGIVLEIQEGITEKQRKGNKQGKERKRREEGETVGASSSISGRWCWSRKCVEVQHGPHKDRRLVTTSGRPYTFSKKVKQRFPRPA
jgi:hypothetical protein